MGPTRKRTACREGGRERSRLGEFRAAAPLSWQRKGRRKPKVSDHDNRRPCVLWPRRPVLKRVSHHCGAGIWSAPRVAPGLSPLPPSRCSRRAPFNGAL